MKFKIRFIKNMYEYEQLKKLETYINGVMDGIDMDKFARQRAERAKVPRGKLKWVDEKTARQHVISKDRYYESLGTQYNRMYTLPNVPFHWDHHRGHATFVVLANASFLEEFPELVFETPGVLGKRQYVFAGIYSIGWDVPSSERIQEKIAMGAEYFNHQLQPYAYNIGRIFVMPKFRKSTGIGIQLVSAVCDWLKHMGFGNFEVSVAPHLVKWYKKQGFTVSSKGGWDSRSIMGKLL